MRAIIQSTVHRKLTLDSFDEIAYRFMLGQGFPVRDTGNVSPFLHVIDNLPSVSSQLAPLVLPSHEPDSSEDLIFIPFIMVTSL